MGERRPAFYAARSGRWRDWWNLLHPPYTVWHLSYVCLGAGLVTSINLSRLGATLLAFFAAVGVAAHALDELQGRPLGTTVSSLSLRLVGGAGLVVAVGLGVAGVVTVGDALIPFIVLGPILVVAYNLEVAGGRWHSTATFALSWGAFPVLTAYVAQTGTLRPDAAVAAAAAFALSWAQRRLSSPARHLRRRVVRSEAVLWLRDGQVAQLGGDELLRPLESALGAMSWGMAALAVALVLARG